MEIRHFDPKQETNGEIVNVTFHNPDNTYLNFNGEPLVHGEKYTALKTMAGNVYIIKGKTYSYQIPWMFIREVED